MVSNASPTDKQERIDKRSAARQARPARHVYPQQMLEQHSHQNNNTVINAGNALGRRCHSRAAADADIL